MSMYYNTGSQYYSSPTSSTVSNQVWQIWAGSTTTTTCTITSVNTSANTSVWITWVADSSASTAHSTACGQLIQFNPPLPQRQSTPVELEQAQQAAEAHRQQTEAAERERKAAHVKAMELLRANLTKKQRDDLDKRNWFLVEGGKSKKTYRIRGNSYAGNIIELQGDQEVARYCVHAEWQIPLGDQLLAQALYLRLDEEYIIGRANKTALTALAA